MNRTNPTLSLPRSSLAWNPCAELVSVPDGTSTASLLYSSALQAICPVCPCPESSPSPSAPLPFQAVGLSWCLLCLPVRLPVHSLHRLTPGQATDLSLPGHSLHRLATGQATDLSLPGHSLHRLATCPAIGLYLPGHSSHRLAIGQATDLFKG